MPTNPPLTSTHAAWQGVNDEMFEQCGIVFSTACTKAAQDTKSIASLLEPIRTWLDEAALRQPRGALAWGFLCNVVLEQHFPNVKTDAFQRDRAWLQAYLAAMETVSAEELSTPGVYVSTVEIHTRRYWTRPVSHGLKRVLNTLGVSRTPGSSTPMLEALLAEGWAPKRLAVRLHELLPEQMQHLRETHGHDGMQSETPYFKLMATLCHAVATSSWKPEDTPVFGAIWNYVGAYNETPVQIEAMHRALVACMPSQIVHGLNNVVSQHSMLNNTVDFFFPLPLDRPEPTALLSGIINILAMTRAADYEFEPDRVRSLHFEQRLAEYHPELAVLISLHFELFPESMDDNTNVAMLLPAFEGLVRKEAVQPANIFDLPNLS